MRALRLRVETRSAERSSIVDRQRSGGSCEEAGGGVAASDAIGKCGRGSNVDKRWCRIVNSS